LPGITLVQRGKLRVCLDVTGDLLTPRDAGEAILRLGHCATAEARGRADPL